MARSAGLRSSTGSTCNIGATSIQPAVNSTDPDCTDVGCNLGAPLEIPNASLRALSSCVQNSYKVAASGTVDLTTGASTTVSHLSSDTYTTGNVNQPCPRCRSAARRPAEAGEPGDRDLRSRAPDWAGLHLHQLGRPDPRLPDGRCRCRCQQLPPAGRDQSLHLRDRWRRVHRRHPRGSLDVDLSPLGTGSSTKTADASGFFCTAFPDPGPQQTTPGCFGKPTCVTITETGTPAGTVSAGTPGAVTLASVFCIPTSGNGLVDVAAGLPGPGATSLPGIFTAYN